MHTWLSFAGPVIYFKLLLCNELHLLLKNISITLYNFKYILYYVHVYSCHQDEQTHCTSILQIFCWKIYSFPVPVYYSTVLCASVAPGKPLTRMYWLLLYVYVHTTKVCKYQLQLKDHVCIHMHIHITFV